MQNSALSGRFFVHVKLALSVYTEWMQTAMSKNCSWLFHYSYSSLDQQTTLSGRLLVCIRTAHDSRLFKSRSANCTPYGLRW